MLNIKEIIVKIARWQEFGTEFSVDFTRLN